MALFAIPTSPARTGLLAIPRLMFAYQFARHVPHPDPALNIHDR
jgi:hypothetical protein